MDFVFTKSVKSSSNNVLVGLFCAGALILLLGFGVFTGGFSSLRDENERFVLVFHENVYGLHEGGKVTLNGVRIGRVERFFLGDASENEPVPVLVEVNRKLVLRHMVEGENEFFDSKGYFKKEAVSQLEGQLVQESFVTGILYINLTIGQDHSSEEKKLYGYREIPTSASIFAELSESINLEKLSKQFSELMQTATHAMNGVELAPLSKDLAVTNKQIQNLILGFSDSYLPLGPKLTSSTEEVNAAFKNITMLSDRLNEMLSPTSDLRFGFTSTMRDISAMSKSLKSLADLLERNPQAFLRGKGEITE